MRQCHHYLLVTVIPCWLLIKKARWEERLPKPKALLIFSAHWEEPDLVFGETIRHEKLIYDFYGFPDELYRLQYPAPGAEWLLEEVRQVLHKKIAQVDRGLDHGVWAPCCICDPRRMYRFCR